MTTSRPAGRRRALVALPLAAVVLAGCAADPRVELRDLVEDVTAAANDRDAAGLRRAVDALIAEVEKQRRDGVLGPTEASRLLDLARQVGDDAKLIEQAPPPPSPTASPSAPPSPSPTSASPSPSPTRSPSPSPSPTPKPTPSEEPEPSPEPSPEPTPLITLTPSPVASAPPSASPSPAQARPTGGPSASPSPAADG